MNRIRIRLWMAMSAILLVVISDGQTTFARENRQSGTLSIVPYPQEAILSGGSYKPGEKTLRVNLSGPEGRQREIMEEELRAIYHKRFDLELSMEASGKADIIMEITENDPQVRELGEEGYILKLQKDKVLISARQVAGLYYGLQSLKQLFRGNPEPGEVPCAEIRDWPSIAFRCIMDDISRGPIPTPEYLRYQVRRYAEMKINHMSFYIEHVVQTEKYPDMAPAEGGISVEEFKELSEYAADYNVKLVGNFQSLGHFEKILSLPQFRHLGATERMLDPMNPEIYDFLGDVYTEMAPAFSSPWFTPNLDEAWDLSRGGLKTAAGELGPAKVYADHVWKVDSLLSSVDKRSFIWGDIVLEHPEILQMIPRDIVMGAWNYSPAESFDEYIDPLTRAGFDFMVAPGVLNSRRLIPDFRMSTINIRNFINEGYEKGALGVYCTVWDDGGLHFFSHDWYGLAYNAEQSWRPNRDPLEDFDRRFSLGIYGDESTSIPGALHRLNRLTDLEPTFEMNSNVFYKELVPGRGAKVSFDLESWEEVKEAAAEALAILESGEVDVYRSDLDYLRFTIAQYLFMADSRKFLLEAATAYEKACMLQRSDRDATTVQLQKALSVSRDLGARMDRLAAVFLKLWDLESREHWRDRAEADFARHQEAFAEQLALLEKAAMGFRAGRYLPPPNEVRLDIRPQEGGFFSYWLMCGPFHLDAFEEMPPDFLGPMGGAGEARPFPGEKFTDTTGTGRSWMKYDSPKQGEIDFTTIFQPNITSVAYCYCSIESPDKRTVTALLGSNDGATVWCNGKQVHHVHGKRSLIPDEDAFEMKLEPGKNHLMIRVEQWKAGWGLSFRLKDIDIRNHKQKYYIQ